MVNIYKVNAMQKKKQNTMHKKIQEHVPKKARNTIRASSGTQMVEVPKKQKRKNGECYAPVQKHKNRQGTPPVAS